MSTSSALLEITFSEDMMPQTNPMLSEYLGRRTLRVDAHALVRACTGCMDGNFKMPFDTYTTKCAISCTGVA
jgi:hypothetical protein